jgi:hypothetical protein
MGSFAGLAGCSKRPSFSFVVREASFVSRCRAGAVFSRDTLHGSRFTGVENDARTKLAGVFNILPRRKSVKGLRFERIGKNRYYNVVFHMGSSYVPVSDETVEELKAQSLLPVERFLDLLIDRVGYSSYLKEQIRTELKSSGDPVTQITVLQGAIREL